MEKGIDYLFEKYMHILREGTVPFDVSHVMSITDRNRTLFFCVCALCLESHCFL